jgi:hypothetical protein
LVGALTRDPFTIKLGWCYIYTYLYKKNTMSNKEFIWTDELVAKAIKERLLTLSINLCSEPTTSFIKSFKAKNAPKPLHTTTDGVEFYDTNDLVFFQGGTYLPLKNTMATTMIKLGLPTFSTPETAEAYRITHERKFSLADVQYLLTRSSYGEQFIQSITEALTKYETK